MTTRSVSFSSPPLRKAGALEEKPSACAAHHFSPPEFVKAYAVYLRRSGKIWLPPWTTIDTRSLLHANLIGTALEQPPLQGSSFWKVVFVLVHSVVCGGSKRNGSCPLLQEQWANCYLHLATVGDDEHCWSRYKWREDATFYDGREGERCWSWYNGTENITPSG